MDTVIYSNYIATDSALAHLDGNLTSMAYAVCVVSTAITTQHKQYVLRGHVCALAHLVTFCTRPLIASVDCGDCNIYSANVNLPRVICCIF